MQINQNNEVNLSGVSLAAVAVRPDQYPREIMPEFVFCGKSNVGKSSLINAMLGRKALARTSRSPGKTRTINFYNVEGRLFFVDLPGYGYAKLSRAESEKWGAMIEKYLIKREQLRRIFLLVDIRHEPSAGDKMMFEWLSHYGYAFTLIATKADKIKRSQLDRQTAAIRRALGGATAAPSVIPFSGETRQGVDKVWEIILKDIDNIKGNPDIHVE